MPRPITIRLRHGLRDGDRVQREAVLRPLCGADELALEEAGPLPAQRVTALLAGTLQRIGTIAPVGADAVRRLTIGDRERLLLALHVASFGPSTEVLATCAACGTVAEVPLDLKEWLALRDEPAVPGEGTIGFEGVTVNFRVPTGADQEQAVALAPTDTAAAAEALLQACLHSEPDSADVATLTDNIGLRAALEEALAAADPDAERVVVLSCPGCGEVLRAVCDAHLLLVGSLRQRGPVLADVHRLAAAYHWSEADILGLPTDRRHRYLALLDRGAAA
jgi:hypothetical protein